jgi:hypothetical protein
MTQDHGEGKLRNRVHKGNMTFDPSNVNAILQSIWYDAGRGDEFVPLTGREYVRK